MEYINENNTVENGLILKEGEIYEVGNIKYNESTSIRFFIDCYKGTKYANIRAFVVSKGYSGPTSRGIKLTQEELSEIINNCNSLDHDQYKTEEKVICKFKRTNYKNTEISVRINRFEGRNGLDIREIYVNTCGELKYGKGIRIKIEFVKNAIELMKQMMESFNETSDVEDLSLLEIIKQSFFFKGKIRGKKIISAHLSDIYLNEIDFNIRFINCIKSQCHLKNLTDLLNTDYIDLLMLPNCGEKTINDARNAILIFLSESDNQYLIQKEIQTELFTVNGSQQFPSEFEFLRNCLKETQINEIINGNEVILNANLKEIDLGIRFQHVLREFPKLKTVRDLLSTSMNELINLRNCGLKSIKKAQELLLKLFTEKQDIQTDNGMNHDDFIVNKLKTKIKIERNLDIFLQYYNYDHSGKTSLEEIGIQYKLTRERVRQIIESIKRTIYKNKHIFSILVSEMKSYGYIFELKNFINHIAIINKCKETNTKFIEYIIKDFLNKYEDILIKGRYVLTSNREVLFPNLNVINNLVSEKIKDSQEGTDMTVMLVYLKENSDSINELNSDKLINSQVLTFISEEYKKFYVVENIIYNEMMYQIYFGKLLTDVVYWSLKYFSEPIHFSQLAEYVRKNNINHKDSPDGSIHSTLMNSKLFMLADYGSYVLKDSKYEKYNSAGDSIYILLNEKGPLTESKIIDSLVNKYSYSNLKLAIRNNLNKRLIRIGNDLYDIKI